MRDYVTGIVSAFRDDARVFAWNIWNEPDNGPQVDACKPAVLGAKAALVAPVLAQAFGWARDCEPTQPVTSGVWLGDWSDDDLLTPIQRIQMHQSDVVSFHNYGRANGFRQRVRWFRRFGRPILCTGYMARPAGSTFEAVLPIAKEQRVGAFCWRLVLGRTQTHLPWKPARKRKQVATCGFTTCSTPTGGRTARKRRRSCGALPAGRR